jgi:phosphoribosylaminoimidazolecarboxamide formyltransferase/IMP cyclohydrolase
MQRIKKSAGVALLSVYDKTGIVEFAKGLNELGWQLYASGGTAKALTKAGLEVSDVAKLVGGASILGHRVVTLSREISAGLLADKTSPDDIKEMAKLKLPIIDLVCVDMYPLESTINQAAPTREEVVAQTDIGGPTMLRSAAKGRRIVVSHADLREPVLNWLRLGKPREDDFIDVLCARAEYEAARYVSISAQYLSGDLISGYAAHRVAKTKYGENPQQDQAAFYADNRIDVDPLGLDQFEHVQGMERSYVNMTDIDRLLQTITHIAAVFDTNFKQVPFMAVGVKHGNACGAAVGKDAVTAVKKMLDGDLRAIFGGVIMINCEIDESIADVLMHYKMPKSSTRLLDGVVGAAVTDSALELLSRNKLRVVVNPALQKLSRDSLDTKLRFRQVRGGFLTQPNYDFVPELYLAYVKTYGKLTESQQRDLVLAWAIGCTSNSNTITIVKDGQLIGNGVGQQDRVGAAQLALTRTTSEFPVISKTGSKISLKVNLDKAKLDGASAYSDSFFPFPDGPELLAKAGIKAIFSTSGSIGDEAVIKSLTKAGVSLVMLPDKFARGFYMH